MTRQEVAAGDGLSGVVHRFFGALDESLVVGVEQFVLAVEKGDGAVEVVVEPVQQVREHGEFRARAREHQRVEVEVAFERERQDDRAAERVADEDARVGLLGHGDHVVDVGRQRLVAGVGRPRRRCRRGRSGRARRPGSRRRGGTGRARRRVRRRSRVHRGASVPLRPRRGIDRLSPVRGGQPRPSPYLEIGRREPINPHAGTEFRRRSASARPGGRLPRPLV
nr:hypothetical protein [Haloferax sp. ATB1]